jgi:hypothetical protein
VVYSSFVLGVFTPRLVATALGALIVALAAATPRAGASTFECARIVALGDLHGGVDSIHTILEATEITDRHRQWTSSDACLVIVGDMVDRGDRSRELLDYVISLGKQAPGQVHVTLGNHEVMNLIGDLRYVTPGEFGAYADLETKKQRRRGRQFFLRTPAALELSGGERKETFDLLFPPGWFGHREAFDIEGRYGAWLLSRPVLLKLGSSLFVHGGIEVGDAARDLDLLNEEIVDQIAEYLRLRKALIEDGWLGPLVSFGAAFGVVDARLSAPEENPDDAGSPTANEIAERFLELRSAGFVRADGPLWTRKLALEEQESYSGDVTQMLLDLGIERIVVGHTSQKDHRIKSRFDDRVFLIDTGAGPAYGGYPSALEIEAGVIRAVYPDEVEILVGPVQREGAAGSGP